MKRIIVFILVILLFGPWSVLAVGPSGGGHGAGGGGHGGAGTGTSGTGTGGTGTGGTGTSGAGTGGTGTGGNGTGNAGIGGGGAGGADHSVGSAPNYCDQYNSGWLYNFICKQKPNLASK